MTISVRIIPPAKHLDFIRAQRSASFLQTPAWAKVKSEWESESLGWFDADNQMIGAGLVLYRQVPKLKRFLAYLPEGPVTDWGAVDIDAFLAPLVAHAKDRGAFGVRIGPALLARAWDAETIKAAIADPAIRSLSEVEPDETNQIATRLHNALRSGGWLAPKPDGEGFAAGQPRFNFWLPLADADGWPRAAEDVLKGMNQLWRRNIKKAAKSGVVVRQGTRGDLAAFHRVYLETAERDRFTPRPLDYFEVMWDALRAEDPDRIRLYLAEHEGDLVAATTWVRVGAHAWYSYGASTAAKRDVRGSNAIQWQMIQDALAAGATVYDLRGITESVASDDPHLGLIQFKVGTGGRAVEYPGEWDLPINRPLYRAFDAYMNRGAITAQVKQVVRNPVGLLTRALQLSAKPIGAVRTLQKAARDQH
ncbi:MAG: peptidoglycan bridge formation glycyltransferase FemA/FemB family protein [Propionibacteriaceae bacterium]|nr:peptidoglycan bridge formation glycyltransferase FemA/FemB family protein [Propionibacteriaceae bacterium]